MLHTHQRGLQDSRRATWGARVSMLLLCAFVSMGLLACASSGSGGAANPTPTTAPAQVQKCGLVQTSPRGVPTNATSAKQTADCFSQAYQKCQPASLMYNATSVDTVVMRTFSIQNSGEQCTISDVVQHEIVPAKPFPAKTYTCSGFISKPDHLQFSGCGEDGTVTIPLQAAGQ